MWLHDRAGTRLLPIPTSATLMSSQHGGSMGPGSVPPPIWTARLALCGDKGAFQLKRGRRDRDDYRRVLSTAVLDTVRDGAIEGDAVSLVQNEIVATDDKYD